MPSNWLYIDTNFPNFTGEESVEDKLSSIQNYMYMLVEQLRYSMRNLDLRNMNQTAVNQFTQNLTKPIYAKIKDDEGKIALLEVSADRMFSLLNDAQGAISSLQQTAGEIVASVLNLQNGMAQTVRIAADGVTITNAEGSKLTIDGGQIDAENLNLTGRISFSDMDSGAQGAINGAANLAKSIANGTCKGTFIDGTAIYSPTIFTNMMNIIADNSRGGMMLTADYFGKSFDMFSISYYNSDEPYVDIYSPADAVLRFCFGNANGRAEFHGTVDFSGATVIGLN